MVATIEITATALMAFRYRSQNYLGDATKNYYYVWEQNHGTAAANFYQIAYMIVDYGKLGLWGVAWIFQIMALFGVLTDINMLIW